MPTYEYRCPAGHQYEKRESFSAPARQKCQECGKQAARLLSAPAVVFKGTGFYVTDSRNGSSSSESKSSTNGASKPASESTTTATESTAPAKNADATEAPAAG